MSNPDENINEHDSCEQCGMWLCNCDEEDQLFEDELERTYDGGDA